MDELSSGGCGCGLGWGFGPCSRLAKRLFVSAYTYHMASTYLYTYLRLCLYLTQHTGTRAKHPREFWRLEGLEWGFGAQST